MNAIETQLAAAPYSSFFITPFQLANNITINSGTTNVYTCGGVGGVPAAATGVYLSAFYTSGTAGMHADFTPHGTAWNNGNYPMISGPTTAIYSGSMVVPLSATQIDVRANGGNIVGIFLWMYGYIY